MEHTSQRCVDTSVEVNLNFIDMGAMGARFQEIRGFCIEFYAYRCEHRYKDGCEKLGFQHATPLNIANIIHLIES